MPPSNNKRPNRALEAAPKLVSATVALMEELARVFALEIDIVSNRRLKEHAELLKYKQKLAMDYRSNMKAIAANPELLKKLSTEAQQAVRDAAKMLALAAEKNALTLRAAVAATQQLIQNVISMVKTQVLSNGSYKNAHTAHLALGNYSPTCRPVAVSRSV